MFNYVTLTKLKPETIRVHQTKKSLREMCTKKFSRLRKLAKKYYLIGCLN